MQETTMNMLGLSACYHDSVAALVRDGEIISASQEERFSRKKHDAGFPQGAINCCLDNQAWCEWVRDGGYSDYYRLQYGA